MKDDYYSKYLHTVVSDYAETKDEINSMLRYADKYGINTIFVSERLSDVLYLYYHYTNYTFIVDPNRIYFEYGFKRKKNKSNDIDALF